MRWLRWPLTWFERTCVTRDLIGSLTVWVTGIRPLLLHGGTKHSGIVIKHSDIAQYYIQYSKYQWGSLRTLRADILTTKVPKPRYLELSYRSLIWQAPQQHSCGHICRYINLKHKWRESFSYFGVYKQYINDTATSNPTPSITLWYQVC